MLNLQDIKKAQKSISSYINYTPLIRLTFMYVLIPTPANILEIAVNDIANTSNIGSIVIFVAFFHFLMQKGAKK